MFDYLSLAILIFLINILPAFMPPTWIVLAIAKINDPSLDPITLTFVGALSSTSGRFVLSYYSGFFRRFFTKNLKEHADQLKTMMERKNIELFFGTLIYSLSPFPSNMIFIADGLTKINSKPIFAGFFLGRLISYFVLVSISHNIFHVLMDYTQNRELIINILDILGIVAAFSMLLVDWKKLVPQAKSNKGKQK